MAVLVGSTTRLLVQGLTGREGAFHTKQSVEYGTKVVAGVTPGKGGQTHEGIPLFDTVAAAKDVGVSVPIVVRLEGTNVERGREILQASGLAFVLAEGMRDAAEKVVAAAGGR